MLSVKWNGLYLITAGAQRIRCIWLLKSSVAPELIHETQSPSILISPLQGPNLGVSIIETLAMLSTFATFHPRDLGHKQSFTTLIQCHYPLPLPTSAA